MHLNNKHIVFLTPGFPKNEEDVNCIPILQNYILYYHKSNPDVKVSVITFHYPFKKTLYKWNDIDVYSIGGANKKGIHRINYWLQVLLCLKKLHAKNKISAIHSFWLTQCAFVGQIASKWLKVKHICTIVGLDTMPGNRYLKLIDFKRNTIVALSGFVAEKFKQTTGKQVRQIISIGLDTESFKPEISVNPTIEILGVGNLHALKNYTLFIEVIEDLVQVFPQLKSLLIGTGEELDMLRNLVSSKGLTKNINLVGKLPRNKVLEIMTDSKLFLHTSVHEGQGYVFEEALYSGMSIVAFNVGNLVPSKRVMLCEDKPEMVKAIILLLNNKPDRNRMLIQSMEDTISKFNTLYFSV